MTDENDQPQVPEVQISIDMREAFALEEHTLKFTIDAADEQRIVETLMKHDPLCAAAAAVSDEPVGSSPCFVPYRVKWVDGQEVHEPLYGLKGESMFEFPDPTKK